MDLDVEDGATVGGDLLEDLRRVKPRVVDLVVNGGDSVRMGGLVVVVNGRSIDFLEGGLRTVLREGGDEVALFPSLVLA